MIMLNILPVPLVVLDNIALVICAVNTIPSELNV